MRRFAATLALLTSLLCGAASAAEVIHFVAYARIADGKQAQFDAFVSAVTPIWSRHGMIAVARGRNGMTDIAVLRVRTRAGFRAYIADPDYQAIKEDRLGAVDELVIFDGVADSASAPTTLKGRLLASFMETEPYRTPTGPVLNIAIRSIGQVKGDARDWTRRVRQVLVSPPRPAPDPKPLHQIDLRPVE